MESQLLDAYKLIGQTSGRGTFVLLAFTPGEAFQFDLCEDWAVLGDKKVELQVARTELSHCKASIARACLGQTHEMVFDAMTHAFGLPGGFLPSLAHRRLGLRVVLRTARQFPRNRGVPP